MCCLKILVVSALGSVLPVWAQLVGDVTPDQVTSDPGYSAEDCLSYIYVAWIYFIYTVGLGVQSTQFYQVRPLPLEYCEALDSGRKWTGKLLKYLTLNI